LRKLDLVHTRPNSDDQRRLFVEASDEGRKLYKNNIHAAKQISDKTLQSLSKQEVKTFLELLAKIT
jgi:DNA-binding MarR family transcriptional regulator